MGKTPAEILGNAAVKLIEKKLNQCLETGESITYEESLSLQGQQTWWMTTINPLKDAENQIYRFVGAAVNITERKQAEAKLHLPRFQNKNKNRVNKSVFKTLSPSRLIDRN